MMQDVLPGMVAPIREPRSPIGRPRIDSEPRPMMPCRLCGTLTEGRRAKPSGNWARALCRNCNSVQQRMATYGASWGDANAPKPDDGLCEICHRDVNLEWDHDHSTGKFRAWLCRHCNGGLMIWIDNLRADGITDEAMRSMFRTVLERFGGDDV